MTLQASLIEYNLEAVDGAIAAVRGALAGGLSWKELKRLIKSERDAGNPVAALIHSLQLEHNRITLALSNLLDEEEEDEEALTRPATLVGFPNTWPGANAAAKLNRGSWARQRSDEGRISGGDMCARVVLLYLSGLFPSFYLRWHGSCRKHSIFQTWGNA